MAGFKDVAAVVATGEDAAARTWYSRVRSAVRIGVDDLDAQITALADLGIGTGEVVVIADLVKVADLAAPGGNEVCFVQELRTY